MGMFDEIRCRYPLPIDIPAWVDWYQTKDLENSLSRFEITEDGRLVQLNGFMGDPNIDDWSGYHADLNFYTSNIVASDQHGQAYTKDGSAAITLEFVARFTNGRVDTIKLVDRTEEPAMPVADWNAGKPLPRGL